MGAAAIIEGWLMANSGAGAGGDPCRQMAGLWFPGPGRWGRHRAPPTRPDMPTCARSRGLGIDPIRLRIDYG